MNYKIALSFSFIFSFSLYCVSLYDQKLARTTGSAYTETIKIPASLSQFSFISPISCV